MKKMNFEQMEVINGGQALFSEGGSYSSVAAATTTVGQPLDIDEKIRPCVVGKWVTGIGLIALGCGIPFACPAAAAGFGIIAGVTTIAC
jgi:hypothetical protein